MTIGIPADIYRDDSLGSDRKVPPQLLPEGVTEDTIIHAHEVTASIRFFLKSGMVAKDGARFYVLPKWALPRRSSNEPKPDPLSARELEHRGFLVHYGTTEVKDAVWLLPGAYYPIKHAIRNGLLTEATQPPQRHTR